MAGQSGFAEDKNDAFECIAIENVHEKPYGKKEAVMHYQVAKCSCSWNP